MNEENENDIPFRFRKLPSNPGYCMTPKEYEEYLSKRKHPKVDHEKNRLREDE